MTKKFLIILMCLALVCPLLPVAANEVETFEYGTGFIDTPKTMAIFNDTCVSPYDVEGFLNTETSGGMSVNATTSLPSSVDLSTSMFFPSIDSQKGQHSCTAWATTYYQFTYEKNKLLLTPTTPSNTSSPAWTYNAGVSTDTGINVQGAYNHLMELGAIPLSVMPFVESDFTSWPTDYTAIREALNVRVQSVVKVDVNSTNSYITTVNSANLNTLKQTLYSGHPVVSVMYLLSEEQRLRKTWNNQSVFYASYANEAEAEADGSSTNHTVTIVGYNDNVWVDINNNGTVESSEYGALKIANSHGTGFENNGYVWVSYDALNLVSQAGSWETPSQKEARRSFFAYSDSGSTNRFYGVSVKKMRPMYIGELVANTTNRQNIKLWASSTITDNANNKTKRLQSEPYTGVYTANRPFNGKLYLDLTPLIIQTTDTNYTTLRTNFYGEDIDYTTYESQYTYIDTILTNCQYHVVDSLGNTIYTYTRNGNEIFNISNESLTLSKQFDLSIRGDVNYDGVVNSADAQLVLKYTVDKVDFSYTQEYFADYDANGTIDSNDAMDIMQAS